MRMGFWRKLTNILSGGAVKSQSGKERVVRNAKSGYREHRPANLVDLQQEAIADVAPQIVSSDQPVVPEHSSTARSIVNELERLAERHRVAATELSLDDERVAPHPNEGIPEQRPSLIDLRQEAIADVAPQIVPSDRPAVPVEPSTARSLVGELERLAELHRVGALTDAEFGAAKAEVLGDSRTLSMETRAVPTSGGATVVLIDVGKDKIAVIKVIRQATFVGLEEAKDIADAADAGMPQVISCGPSSHMANRFAAAFEAAGARVAFE
jgi:ribosomal protein L7/L12